MDTFRHVSTSFSTDVNAIVFEARAGVTDLQVPATDTFPGAYKEIRTENGRVVPEDVPARGRLVAASFELRWVIFSSGRNIKSETTWAVTSLSFCAFCPHLPHTEDRISIRRLVMSDAHGP